MIWVLTYCTITWGACFAAPVSVEFSTGKKDCLEALAMIEKQSRANDQKFRGVCAPKVKS
jgi:hypothetical protein